MINQISEIDLEYVTFSEERKPKIGIYYIFPEYIDKGLCKEFKIDLKLYANIRRQKISPILDYEFISESKLLNSLERNKIQGIKTKIPSQLSFENFCKIIAEVHLREFFKRHEWIKEL
jgi:hypothetical protein